MTRRSTGLDYSSQARSQLSRGSPESAYRRLWLRCDTGVVKIDWTYQLTEQLDWHWRSQLRRRYEGLTDAEYFWEAVANCWNVHPRGQGRAPIEAGGGTAAALFRRGPRGLQATAQIAEQSGAGAASAPLCLGRPAAHAGPHHAPQSR